MFDEDSEWKFVKPDLPWVDEYVNSDEFEEQVKSEKIKSKLKSIAYEIEV